MRKETEPIENRVVAYCQSSERQLSPSGSPQFSDHGRGSWAPQPPLTRRWSAGGV